MTVWVDADACPQPVRQILFRAAARTGVAVTLVANRPVDVPRAANVTMMQVPQGFDVADNEIVRRVASGDLVVTSDIPLAAEVIARGASALSPRGEAFSADDIRAKLNLRDFMDTMRASGVDTRGGPAPFGQREKQAFANGLDRYLAQYQASAERR